VCRTRTVGGGVDLEPDVHKRTRNLRSGVHIGVRHPPQFIVNGRPDRNTFCISDVFTRDTGVGEGCGRCWTGRGGVQKVSFC